MAWTFERYLVPPRVDTYSPTVCVGYDGSPNGVQVEPKGSLACQRDAAASDGLWWRNIDGSSAWIEEWAVLSQTTVIAGGNGVGKVGDLNTSPVDVVAAPGANKIIVVEDVTYKFVYATAAYDGAGAGDDLVLRYSAGARAEVTGDVDNGHGGAIRFARAGAGTDYAYLKAIVGDTIPEVNTSVQLWVRNNDPFTAAGGGSLEVTVTYRIIDVS